MTRNLFVLRNFLARAIDTCKWERNVPSRIAPSDARDPAVASTDAPVSAAPTNGALGTPFPAWRALELEITIDCPRLVPVWSFDVCGTRECGAKLDVLVEHVDLEQMRVIDAPMGCAACAVSAERENFTADDIAEVARRIDQAFARYVDNYQPTQADFDRMFI